MVDFTLSDQQKAIRGMAQHFASQVLSTASQSYEKFPTQRQRFQALRPFYSHAVAGGMLKGMIPASLGGMGGGVLDSTILVEEMYKVDRSLSLTIFGTGLGLSPLIIGGSESQHIEFLEPFLSGSGEPVASLVHSEPGGTANWLLKGGKGLGTTAKKDGENWVVDGEKMWATNSSGWDDKGADLQCLVVRCVEEGKEPPVDPAEAIMILLITRAIVAQNPPEAYQVLSHMELPGHTSASGPHVKYTSFRVPSRNVLAFPGKGAAVVQQCFTATAALVGAMATGIMAAAFETALKFAKSDARGGAVPIINHQSVANLLMDIKMRADASRFLTWKAAHALDNNLGGELSLEAKIWCSDSAVKAVVDAMNAIGMSSYNKETDFPRLLNDAMCLPLFDGGNVGIRRRALEKIMMDDKYEPWASTFG